MGTRLTDPGTTKRRWRVRHVVVGAAMVAATTTAGCGYVDGARYCVFTGDPNSGNSGPVISITPIIDGFLWERCVLL